MGSVTHHKLLKLVAPIAHDIEMLNALSGASLSQDVLAQAVVYTRSEVYLATTGEQYPPQALTAIQNLVHALMDAHGSVPDPSQQGEVEPPQDSLPPPPPGGMVTKMPEAGPA